MMEIKRLGQTDVLVIGGGLAAMNAAINAEKSNQNIMMISKSKVGLSGSSPCIYVSSSLCTS